MCMETVQSYKCPCCGAPLAYRGDSGSLHCDSCGNDFSAETMQQLSEAEAKAKTASKFDWTHYEPRSYEGGGDVDISSYSCPSCGAEISGDDSLGSTVCPYCGSATIVKGQFEGALQPDFIIPFKIDKNTAVSAFENDFKNAPFLPDEFKNKKRIEEMSGVYVPFWMFDCDCNANITYSARTLSFWSDSDYDYTKTDYYRLLRGGSVGFANIPVDASQKADNAYMEAVEPFNYGDAVDFNTGYLSGFLADKYDVSAEDSIERANERVKNSTESVFAETTKEYGSVTPESTNVSFSDGRIRYSLLPVWMLNIKYRGKNYKFAVNGQTGKVVGEYPVDKGKKWRYFGKVAAIAYAAAAVVAWLLLN